MNQHDMLNTIDDADLELVSGGGCIDLCGVVEGAAGLVHGAVGAVGEVVEGVIEVKKDLLDCVLGSLFSGCK